MQPWAATGIPYSQRTAKGCHTCGIKVGKALCRHKATQNFESAERIVQLHPSDYIAEKTTRKKSKKQLKSDCHTKRESVFADDSSCPYAPNCIMCRSPLNLGYDHITNYTALWSKFKVANISFCHLLFKSIFRLDLSNFVFVIEKRIKWRKKSSVSNSCYRSAHRRTWVCLAPQRGTFHIHFQLTKVPRRHSFFAFLPLRTFCNSASTLL